MLPNKNGRLIEVPVANPEELKKSLDLFVQKRKRIDAIVTLAEPVSAAPPYVEILGKFATTYNIPWGGALILKKMARV